MRLSTLDIGGLAIKSAVFEDGVLENFAEIPTRTDLGAAWLLRTAAAIAEGHRPDAIGIAIRGQVDHAAGTLIYDATYEDYCNLPVKAALESYLRLPVAVENDANCAALAEGRLGAAQGFESYLCLTLGSGIGGAMVLDGKLWRGRNHLAGEFGLMAFPGDDPLSDTWEQYAATSALLYKAGLLGLGITDGHSLLAARHHPRVAALLARWARDVAFGLRTLIHSFDPPCLVLGGGLMSRPELFALVEHTTHASLSPGYAPVIRPAALGTRAGLWGAYLMADGGKP